MIIKKIYSKPETEVIEIEATTSVMVGSAGSDLGNVGDAEDGSPAYSKRPNFWNKDN